VKDNSGKRVLLLGAGMVAEPVVDALVERPEVNLTIASLFEKDAKKLAKNNSRVATSTLDITNKQTVGDLVKAHDVVISLVPATFHPSVAESCIENKKNMVTASYISPAMLKLHER
jgi:alpha-aminoadipic semialdehyde synthase